MTAAPGGTGRPGHEGSRAVSVAGPPVPLPPRSTPAEPEAIRPSRRRTALTGASRSLGDRAAGRGDAELVGADKEPRGRPPRAGADPVWLRPSSCSSVRPCCAWSGLAERSKRDSEVAACRRGGRPVHPLEDRDEAPGAVDLDLVAVADRGGGDGDRGHGGDAVFAADDRGVGEGAAAVADAGRDLAEGGCPVRRGGLADQDVAG